MASNRRSSILKIQTNARMPLSGLDFHPPTPTDNGAKSRRVSFSRKKDVAEFIADDATTSWKHFYEVPNNHTMDSSQNETSSNCTKSNEDLEKDVLQYNEQIQTQFVSLSDADFLREDSENPGEIFVMDGNANTGVLNVTQYMDPNIMRQMEELEGLDVGGNGQAHSMMADPDDICVSVYMPSEMTMGHNIIEIDENDEVLNMMKEIEESDKCRTVGVSTEENNDQVDELDILADLLSENICPPKRTARSLQNQTLEHIAESFGVDKENIKQKSELEIVSKKVLILDDASVSCEQLLVNPVLSTRKTASRVPVVAIHDKENIPVLSLKRSYSGVEEVANKKINKMMNADVYNIPYDNILTEELDSKIIFKKKRTSKVVSKATQKIDVFNEFQLPADTSMTCDVVSNVLSNKTKETEKTTDEGNRKDYDESNADMSTTQANNHNNLILAKNSEMRIACNKYDPFVDKSLTQATRHKIRNLVKNSENTLIFNKDESCGNISITQAVIHYNDVPDVIKCPSKTIVFNKNETMNNMSLTQAVFCDSVPNLVKDSGKSMVFNKDDSYGNMSITQAVNRYEIPSLMKDSRKTTVFNKDAMIGNMSLTQAVINGVTNVVKNSRKTIVFNKDDSCCNMSISQAANFIDIPNLVTDSRKTMVFNKEDMIGNMSLTQALVPNSTTNVIRDSRKTMVFNKDDLCSNMSVTQAVHYNDIHNFAKDSRKTIVDKDDVIGNVSLTQAVIPNSVTNVVFNKDDSCGNMSVTQAVHYNDIQNFVRDSRKIIVEKDDVIGNMSLMQGVIPNSVTNVVRDSGKTMVFNKDDSCGNMSVTQAVHHNDIHNLAEDLRKTIVNKDDIISKMSLTQAVILNSATNVFKDSRKTTVFNKDDSCGNLSITQTADLKEIPNLVTDSRKTVVFNKEDMIGNMSLMQAVIRNSATNVVRDSGKTTVFNKDDSCGNMSVTQAVHYSDIQNLAKDSRKTIVINKNEVIGNISLMQAVIPNNTTNVNRDLRKTMVFNKDDSCSNMSVTQAVHQNDTHNFAEDSRKIIVDKDNIIGKMSLTQTVVPNSATNVDKDLRKTMVFNKDDSCGNLSITQTADLKEIPNLVTDSRKTVVFNKEDMIGNMSLMQAVIRNSATNVVRDSGKTTVFNKDDSCGNMSVTQAVHYSDIQNLAKDSRKTIVINRNEIIGHISLTQPVNLNSATNLVKDSGKTLVFNNNDSGGKMSITKAGNRYDDLPNVVMDSRETIIFNKDDTACDISQTQAVILNRVPNMIKDSQNIVFNTDEPCGNISDTRADKHTEIPNLMKDSRKTIVTNERDRSDMSLTKTGTLFDDQHSDKELKKTRIFNKDDPCGNVFIPQAVDHNEVPYLAKLKNMSIINKIVNLPDMISADTIMIDLKVDKESEKVVFNEDVSLGNMCMSRAVALDTMPELSDKDEGSKSNITCNKGDSHVKLNPILTVSNFNDGSEKAIINENDSDQNKLSSIIANENSCNESGNTGHGNARLGNMSNNVLNLVKPIRETMHINLDDLPTDVCMTETASLNNVDNINQDMKEMVHNEHSLMNNEAARCNLSKTISEVLKMPTNVNNDNSPGNLMIPQPILLKEIEKSVKFVELFKSLAERIDESSKNCEQNNETEVNKIDSNKLNTNEYQNRKSIVQVVHKGDDMSACKTVESSQLLEHHLPEIRNNFNENDSLRNAYSNCSKNHGENNSVCTLQDENMKELNMTYLKKTVKILEPSANDSKKICDQTKTYEIPVQKENVSTGNLSAAANSKDSSNVFIDKTLENEQTPSRIATRVRRCTYTVKSKSVMDDNICGNEEDSDGDSDRLHDKIPLIEDTSPILIDRSVDSPKFENSENVPNVAADAERVSCNLQLSGAFIEKDTEIIDEALKTSAESLWKAMEIRHNACEKLPSKERPKTRKKQCKSVKMLMPVNEEKVMEQRFAEIKADKLEGFKIEKEISKVDCLRTYCSSYDVEHIPWRFYFQNGKLCIRVEPKRSSHQDSKNMDPDSAILNVGVELTDGAASLEPMRLLCRKVLLKILDAQALKCSYPLEKNISGMIQSVCEDIARVGRWRNEIMRYELKYAFNLDAEFCLTWNIANCPLRTLWSIKTQILLDDLPKGFPRLAFLSINKICGNTEVSAEELEAVLVSVTPSWNAVTDGVKAISKFLIAKNKEEFQWTRK